MTINYAANLSYVSHVCPKVVQKRLFIIITYTESFGAHQSFLIVTTILHKFYIVPPTSGNRKFNLTTSGTVNRKFNLTTSGNSKQEIQVSDNIRKQEIQ